MKKLIPFLILATLCCAVSAQKASKKDQLKNRIAVLDFKPSANVEKGDAEAITSIFSTYFSPKGFVQMERSQLARIVREQGLQGSFLTQKETVKLFDLYNVRYIVVGEINLVMGQYNVDLRVIDAQTAEVVAKEGQTWDATASYRESLETMANRLAAKTEAAERKRREEAQAAISARLQSIANHKNSIGLLLTIGWDYTYGLSAFCEIKEVDVRPIGLSFQKKIGNNRLEFDFGLRSYYRWMSFNQYHDATFLGLTGSYQWIRNIAGPLGVYTGGGLSLGFGRTNTYHRYSRGLDLGLLAVAGAELCCKNRPWLFSFDVRPRVHFIAFKDCNFRMTYNLGIRYTF